MNFFTEQDQARRNTKRLFVLFLLAIVILIVLTNLLVATTYWVVDGQLGGFSGAIDNLGEDAVKANSQYFTWQNFGKISLLVCGVIACAVVYKWLQLRGGGKRVALALGGERVNLNTQDPDMNRVLNVVEEMALASGMPVPSVYLLKGEKGINAFAAGNTPADAVIGITQGALDQFNREQLQGVIAHEFSHILNGDMRLNIKMIALLHGILFIGGVGEFCMRSGGRHHYSSSRSSGDIRVFLLGLALLVIGWLGVFFGELIKAAISRQREFLADASAVQFTRNPKGIADALKIIGGYRAGSRVFSSHTRETSHMFISEALGSLLRFDTHPPLTARIKRIQPDWNGQFEERSMKVAEQATRTRTRAAPAFSTMATAAVVVGAALNNIGGIAGSSTNTNTSTSIAELRQHAQDPFGASALAFALLLDSNSAVQAKQLDYIKLTGIHGLMIQTLTMLPLIINLDKSHRLTVIEIIMPALKTMSKTQYKLFKKVLLLLIRADAKFDIFEWCLYQLVRHYLGAEFEENALSKPMYKTIEQVQSSYQLVVSMMAYHGHEYDHNLAINAYNSAMTAVGIHSSQLLARDQCLLDEFIKAVNALANCYPLLKPRLLKGLAQCILHDNKITGEEKEILTAIAAVMDCPMPNLFDDVLNRTSSVNE